MQSLQGHGLGIFIVDNVRFWIVVVGFGHEPDDSRMIQVLIIPMQSCECHSCQVLQKENTDLLGSAKNHVKPSV